MLDIAREMLAAGRGPARFVDQALGPDLGQCCGGRVKILIETFDSRDLAGYRAARGGRGRRRVVRGRVPPGGGARAARISPPPWATTAGPAGARPMARSARPFCSSAPAMWAVPSSWRLRRCLSRALDRRAGRMPFRPTSRRTRRPCACAIRRPRSPRPAASSLRPRHDPRPPARSRDHGGGAAAGLSLCRPDRQRHRSGRGSRSASARSAFRRTRIRALVCPIGLPGIDDKDPAIIAASVTAQLLQRARTRTRLKASRLRSAANDKSAP